MTTTRSISETLTSAVADAALAPSVHNTQPWRFVIEDGSLHLYSDPSRRLPVMDPSGRQLLISCGCALLNVRASVAADGYTGHVTRFPNPSEPYYLARVTLGPPSTQWQPIARLQKEVARRHSNRYPYFDQPVPSEVIYDLCEAAADEGASLIHVVPEQGRDAVIRLSRRASDTEELDPAYLAEVEAWTTTDPRRVDGVSAMSVPLGGADADREAFPGRDFDPRGMGWLPRASADQNRESFFVLATAQDRPVDWLRAGEALQRVWLELTRAGFAASLLTQVVEVPFTRSALRDALELETYPHVLLRVGRAPMSPASNRRPLSETLTVLDR
jgi:hypothetical protein